MTEEVPAEAQDFLSLIRLAAKTFQHNEEVIRTATETPGLIHDDDKKWWVLGFPSFYRGS